MEDKVVFKRALECERTPLWSTVPIFSRRRAKEKKTPLGGPEGGVAQKGALR
jgi:hypothetical protein